MQAGFAAADVVETRITCEGDCSRFHAPSGMCMAAKTGARKDVPRQYHPAADVMRCCEFFIPKHKAADQRTAAQRWPVLCAEYEALHNPKKESGERILGARERIHQTLRGAA